MKVLPKISWAQQAPTYQQADPALIDAALQRAHRRPTGNWYVFAASTDVRGDRPFGTRVAGLEIVAWRDETGGLHVGPATCPHLGAD
ncbi:MAG: Rieske (2Fe-2S) protein, partial [Mycobacterium sp.]|nr:Rieske (2Fe-2S) protein [Mycobacterium sp.]